MNYRLPIVVILLLSVFGCASLRLLDDHIYFKNSNTGFPLVCVKETEKPLTGTFARYYDNGQVEFEMSFRKGVRNGPTTRWNENGIKESCERFVNGEKNGLSFYWHPNGQLAEKTQRVDGIPHGKVQEWHDNGQRKLIGTFACGIGIGKLTEWTLEGGKSVTTSKRNGNIERVVLYHQNGRKSKEEISGGHGMVVVGEWDSKGRPLRPIMDMKIQKKLLEPDPPPFQPTYGRTLTVKQASTTLELTLPVEVMLMSSLEDGGTVIGSLRDSKGKRFVFRRSPWAWSDPIYYYIDHPTPSGKPIKLEYDDKRLEAIRVLSINWF